MFKKTVILIVCLFQFALVESSWAQEVKATATSSTASIAAKPPKPPGFYTKFLDFFKKKKKITDADVKATSAKPKKGIKGVKQEVAAIKQDVADVKKIQKDLEDMVGKLAPEVNKPANGSGASQKLIEFSLHAIEQSKYLSIYDSKNYYRTEKQWGEFVGQTETPEEIPYIKRNWGDKTIYGFHPFWMGLNYYQYNFELYDRVAYFGYAVDPETGKSATLFPAHSFKTSQIVRKAAERSEGKCKVDLSVNSYGLANNTLLFSGDWENKINTLTDEVVQLVTAANADGICLDFQQIATSDSTKFIKLVKLFHDKFEAISPGRYQITMVLPSYSQYFPYTIAGKDFLELWQYTNRFIVMGYSSFAGLYNPAKDSLAAGVSHDVLWNILLVDDGINHYSLLAQDVSAGPVSPERIISDKLLLSLPACEIKFLARDSLLVLKYSDLKLFKFDEGFLPSFQEKLAYTTAKNLKGLALWGMGYDNGLGAKDLQTLLATYSYGAMKQDQGLLKAMEKLIAENKSLTFSISELFPLMDSTEASIPLPDVLKVDLPSSENPEYTTKFDKEALIIQHVVVLCLIIFLFFAIIGVIVALFFESVRESILTKENALFLFAFFSLIGLVILLKKLSVINNTIFLFSLGILLGAVIPFLIRRKQRNHHREDRP